MDNTPHINLNVPTAKEENNIISDEELKSVFSEIMDNIRKDRKEVDEYIQNMADMVFNDGDATSATKEAFVNLVKIKLESSDKMARIADFMTRVKMKEKDTFPKYLAVHQNNTISDNKALKRELIKQVNKAKKKEEDEHKS